MTRAGRGGGSSFAALFSLLLAAAVASPLAAQRVPLARHAAMEAASARRFLLGEALGEGEIEGDLRQLCDEIGPRLSGTAQGRRAEDWAYVRFRDAGLAGVRFDDFRMTAWRSGRVEASVVGPQGETPLHPRALAWSPPTGDDGLSAAVVDAGHCTPEEIEALGGELRGKAALCRVGAPPGGRAPHRVEQVSLVAAAGGVAMLLANDVPGLLPQAGSVALGRTAPIPALSLSLEEGEWIARRLERGQGTWRLRFLLEASESGARARNVVGEIPGTPGEEVVMLGAHLDSWDGGTGAVDNGTGVAVLLEAARLLARLEAEGWAPRRTVRFVLFMGEEQGMLGSRAWVQGHLRDLGGIRAMVNLDVVGEPVAFLSYGHDEAVAPLEETARRLRGLGVRSVIDQVVLHSDHQPFLLEGVPTLGLETRLPEGQGRWYHTSADTYDKLDPPVLHRAAAAVAVLLHDLSTAETLPNRRYGREETRAMLEAQGVWEVLRREGATLD